MQLFSFFHQHRSILAHILFILLVLAAGWLPVVKFLEWGWEFTWDRAGQLTLGIMLLSFGPGLAVLAAFFFGHSSRASELGLTQGKFFYLIPAWFLFPLLAALAAAISVFAGFAEWDWHMGTASQNLYFSVSHNFILPTQHSPNPFALISGYLLFGPVVWFLPAWAEEIAWRGYLYQWLKKTGFWLTGILTGLVWWLWRLPLYLHGYIYIDKTTLALGISLCFALETGIVLTWLRRLSGNVFVPALAHATLFGSALIPLTFTRLNDPHWAHLQGIIGIIVLAVFISLGWIAGLFKSEHTA